MRTVSIPNRTLLSEIAKILSEGKKVTIKAKGCSMLPFIVGGRDSVVLQKRNRVTIGDIVLAEIAPGHFVLHRIIKIEDGEIVLMGDGNLSETEECRESDIKGHAITVIYNGKEIDCNSESQRCKARLWQRLLPVRRYLLAIYRRIIL